MEAEYDERYYKIEIEWCWLTYDDMTKCSSFKFVPYEPSTVIKVYDEFKHIKTFDDLKKNIVELNKVLVSYGLKFFECKYDPRCFLIDDHGWRLWTYEPDTGYIRTFDELNDPYKLKYVAKSLPEFLNRLQSDGYEFYKKNGIERTVMDDEEKEDTDKKDIEDME